MTKAAACGRLNFKEADSDDVRWILRERLVLNQLENDLLTELSRQKQMQFISTAVWPNWDDNGKIWNSHFDSGNEHLIEFGKGLMPYLSWDKKDQYKSEVADMRAEYVKKFGDPSSPAAKAQARKDSDALKQRRLEANQKAAAVVQEQREREEKLRNLRKTRRKRRI